LKKYATVNCLVPIARTRLTTDATPSMADIMSKTDETGFDVFNPVNFAPMAVFLASDKARKITGEVFRIAGDKCWIYQGWHAVNMISNEGKKWTPQILAERVKSELMKGTPRKETLMDAVGLLIKM